jgi:excisionase family DNA binding protein
VEQFSRKLARNSNTPPWVSWGRIGQRWKLAPEESAKEIKMPAHKLRPEVAPPALPALRFDVFEAAKILRMSRAQLYNRIQDGSLKPHKDGARTYITRAELERYVHACSV